MKILQTKIQAHEDNIYDQHLKISQKDQFHFQVSNPENSQRQRNYKKNILSMQTNFGISVDNQYVFILLHLRNRGYKNPISINIPEISIFIDQIPYDILYNQDKHIRSIKYKGKEKHISISQVHKFFKFKWLQHKFPKSQHCLAHLKYNQFLMLSDTDLTINFRKNKHDTFFKKLSYIQNKRVLLKCPIIITYPAQDNIELIKLATQCLMGFKEDAKIKQIMSQERYLQFLNEKICLFLNYEHNIRLNKGEFIYGLDQNGEYLLINVINLQFTNLTQALKRRQTRLKILEDHKNSILYLTPQKEVKYKCFESQPIVTKIEAAMSQKLESDMRKLKLSTISQGRREQIKNQIAFKKLHPRIKMTYNQVINAEHFLKMKKKLFNKTNRKPITQPSLYVMKFYNSNQRIKKKYNNLSMYD